MEIPQFWVRVQGEAETPDDAQRAMMAWGWSTIGVDQARVVAAERLQRLLDRVKQGAELPKHYAYGSRPMREQILEQIPAGGNDPIAMLTRNGYGSVVLNTARLLFMDVDVPENKPASAPAVLETLRAALRDDAATFRIYRTAAGYRAMAINREFTPVAEDTNQLLRRCGADPAFVQLCRVQKCFRARLTPKPWRSNYPAPPGDFPRETPQERQQFEQWVKGYDAACRGFATCRFLETVGSGSSLSLLEPVIRIHDNATRCQENLPLA